jgi:hypothetical protein
VYLCVGLCVDLCVCVTPVTFAFFILYKIVSIILPSQNCYETMSLLKKCHRIIEEGTVYLQIGGRFKEKLIF